MTEVRSSRRSGDDQWGAGGHTIATPMPKLRMYTMPLTSFCAYLNGTAQAHNFLKDSTLEKAPWQLCKLQGTWTVNTSVCDMGI